MHKENQSNMVGGEPQLHSKHLRCHREVDPWCRPRADMNDGQVGSLVRLDGKGQRVGIGSPGPSE